MKPLRSPLSVQAPNLSKITVVSPKPCKAITEALEELNTHRREIAEKRDDNQLRQEKVEQLLQEFLSDSPKIDTPKSLYSNMPRSSRINKSIYLAEKILGYYNIKLEVIKVKKSDSALVIEPITEDNGLVTVLKDMIPKLCAFPYSFLRSLNIASLTFCGNINLVHPKHASVYNQKVLNGIFPIQKLVNSEKTANYLYRTMMYKLVKHEPKFTERWRKVLERKDPDVLEGKKEYQDLTDVFRAFVESKTGKLENVSRTLRAKVEELGKMLSEVDPVGITGEWVSQDDKMSSMSEENNKENLVFLTLNDFKSAKW